MYERETSKYPTATRFIDQTMVTLRDPEKHPHSRDGDAAGTEEKARNNDNDIDGKN